MIPVPDLLALLSEQADNGDEDAAIQLNAMAPYYPPETLLAARNIFPIPVGRHPPVIAEPAPSVAPPQTLGEIMAEGLGSVRPSHDWEMFEAAVDLIAGHYGLHRDDAFDALLDLESAILADGGQPLATGLLAQPWGFAVAGLRVAERFIADADALPALHLTVH